MGGHLFDEAARQLSAVLFVGLGIRPINYIMEENGKFNNVELMLAQFFFALGKALPVPLLQQPKDVLVCMIVPPVFRIAKE